MQFTNTLLNMQTKPSSQDREAAARRQAIRDTWLPRVLELAGVSAKFVVGRAAIQNDEAILQQEIQQHPDEFLVLDVDVRLLRCHSSLFCTCLASVPHLLSGESPVITTCYYTG